MYGKPPQMLKASHVWSYNSSDAEFEEHRSGSIVKYIPQRIPPGESKGIALGITPQELADHERQMVEYLRHELLHVFVSSVSPTRPMDEAVVERLNRKYSLHSKQPIHSLPWQSTRFSSSCGIATDDFADIEQSH